MKINSIHQSPKLLKITIPDLSSLYSNDQTLRINNHLSPSVGDKFTYQFGKSIPSKAVSSKFNTPGNIISLSTTPHIREPASTKHLDNILSSERNKYSSDENIEIYNTKTMNNLRHQMYSAKDISKLNPDSVSKFGQMINKGIKEIKISGILADFNYKRKLNYYSKNAQYFNNLTYDKGPNRLFYERNEVFKNPSFLSYKKQEDVDIVNFANDNEIINELNKLIKEGKEDGLHEAREILKSEKGRKTIRPLVKYQSDPLSYPASHNAYTYSPKTSKWHAQRLHYFPSLNKNFIQSKIEKEKHILKLKKIDSLYI